MGRGEPGEAMDEVGDLQRELEAELPGTRGHAQWEGQRSIQS